VRPDPLFGREKLFRAAEIVATAILTFANGDESAIGATLRRI